MNITFLVPATPFAQNQATGDRPDSSKTPLRTGATPVSLSNSPNPKQSALELVEQTLAKAYEKVGLRLESGSNYQQLEPLTAEKVADNILGFISRRLEMDLAEGATAEELQSRLNAGMSGFKQGFADASEKLEALSMLSPEIKQDIGRIYDWVTKGINLLQQKYFPNTGALPDAVRQESTAQISVMSQSYQYASAQQFDFELTTKEGDRIAISASYNKELAYSGLTTNGDRDIVSGNQLSAITSAEANWSVVGDLNEQELTAISELLEQMNQLAGEFFGGSLNAAFNQALELGYDAEQIATFSLNLTRIEIQKVSTVYQAFNGQPKEGISLAETLLPLGHFIKHLLETVDHLQTHFPQAKEIVTDVAENMATRDRQIDPNAVGDFGRFVQEMLNNLAKV